MHIQDFYSRFTATAEESHLFQALRSLSQVEDPQRLTGQPGIFADDAWPEWPPMAMEAGASMAA